MHPPPYNSNLILYHHTACPQSSPAPHNRDCRTLSHTRPSVHTNCSARNPLSWYSSPGRTADSRVLGLGAPLLICAGTRSQRLVVKDILRLEVRRYVFAKRCVGIIHRWKRIPLLGRSSNRFLLSKLKRINILKKSLSIIRIKRLLY